MRKSKAEAARTRERIIAAAAGEFRQHGVVATGLADLMKAAGLTHGGFYKHFASKDDVVREVAAAATSATTATIRAAAAKRRGKRRLAGAVEEYLSAAHRDNPARGCAFASIGPELGRGGDATRAEATAGFLKFVEMLQDQTEGLAPADARRRSLAAASSMIGAMLMSRMVSDATLSDAILSSTAEAILRSFE